MQVYWYELLKLLQMPVNTTDPAVLQHCPVHSTTVTTPTLRVISLDTINDWYFICNDPRCHFSGNSLALVCAAKKLDIRSAYRQFLPGGSLCSSADIETEFPGIELIDENSQAELQEYFNRCQSTLRSSDALINLRVFGNTREWLADKPHGVPSGIGILLTEAVPKMVQKHIRTSMVKNKTYAITRYSFNHRITQFKITNLDNSHNLPTVIDCEQRHGIFMEENIQPDIGQLFITSDERMACNIYQRYMLNTTKVPPLICTDTAELPASCSQLKAIHFLVSGDDNVIPLTTMCRQLATFQGKIYVEEADASRDPAKICERFAGYMRQVLANNVTTITKAVTLQMWLTKHIRQALKHEKPDAAKNFIMRYLSDPKVRSNFLEWVDRHSGYEDVSKILNITPLTQSSAIVLANGRQLYYADDGMRAGSPLSSTYNMLLTNLHIRVLAKCVDLEGNLTYKLEITECQNKKKVVIEASLDELESSKKLEASIRRAYALEKYAPYIVIYDSGHGYSWPDIISKLAEQAEMQYRVTALGMQGNIAYFPNFSLDTENNTLLPAPAFDDHQTGLADMYRGLPAELTSDVRPALRQLLELANHQAIAGIVIGLMHWIHQFVVGSLTIQQKRRFIPTHLLYVENVKDSWVMPYSQLLQIFSGQAQLPGYDYRTSRQRDMLRMLGNLPVFEIPKLRTANMFRQLLGSVPISFITLTDMKTAAMLDDPACVNFVNAADYTKQHVTSLHPEDLALLQRVIPAGVLDLFTLLKDDVRTRKQLTMSAVPAVEMYNYYCKLLGIEPKTNISDMVTCFYAGLDVVNAELFMVELHKGIARKQIEISNRAPTTMQLRAKTPPLAFVLDTCVLLSKAVVHLLNRCTTTGGFKIRHINQELEQKDYLIEPADIELDVEKLNIDLDRFWILDRKVWDEYTTHEPVAIDFKLVTENERYNVPKLLA